MKIVTVYPGNPAGGLATFPDPDNDIWYTCNRTALADLFNRVGQLGNALKNAGVIADAPAKPEPGKK